MNSMDYISGVAMGMILALILVYFCFHEVVEIGEESIDAVKYCEINLSRDQYCTIIAVPKNELED